MVYTPQMIVDGAAQFGGDLVARRVRGRCPLIGVGGVDSWEAAWEKIGHGASLVQVYSGLVYQGPGLVRAICRGLDAELARLKLNAISQAVGRQL